MAENATTGSVSQSGKARTPTPVTSQAPNYQSFAATWGAQLTRAFQMYSGQLDYEGFSRAVYNENPAITGKYELQAAIDKLVPTFAVDIVNTPAPPPQAQPEVRRALPVNATPAITSSEVVSETIGQPTRAGERYPQTRQRLLAIEDINGLNAAEVRYAINEIYARHGSDFPKSPGNPAAIQEIRLVSPRR